MKTELVMLPQYAAAEARDLLSEAALYDLGDRLAAASLTARLADAELESTRILLCHYAVQYAEQSGVAAQSALQLAARDFARAIDAEDAATAAFRAAAAAYSHARGRTDANGPAERPAEREEKR